MNNLRQLEKDEAQALQNLVEQMNKLHAEMGGGDKRPERAALLKCRNTLQEEIDRSRATSTTVSVPVTPTTKMLSAGILAQQERLKSIALGGSLPPIDGGMREAWDAMLKAAPKPGDSDGHR